MSDTNLSIENQFSHATFCRQVEQMSPDQARQMVCFLHEQLLLQREAYQQMLASQWGMVDTPRAKATGILPSMTQLAEQDRDLEQ